MKAVTASLADDEQMAVQRGQLPEAHGALDVRLFNDAELTQLVVAADALCASSSQSFPVFSAKISIHSFSL